MTQKRIFNLVHAEARRRAAEACRELPDGWMVVMSEPTRSLDQNAVQWPILQAFANQLTWPVNGEPVTLTPDEWKAILTAAFEREHVRLAEALEGGGKVMLGSSTSKFGKKKFSDWIEFLNSTAVARDVDLSRRYAS